MTRRLASCNSIFSFKLKVYEKLAFLSKMWKGWGLDHGAEPNGSPISPPLPPPTPVGYCELV